MVAGQGSALVHRLKRERLASAEVALTPGAALVRRDADDARQIIAVTQPLLVLQLTREAAAPLPSRLAVKRRSRLPDQWCGVVCLRRGA